MQALIERYDLADKSMISIGTGRAHEEFHFLEAGGGVDLLDLLDNDKRYRSVLKRNPAAYSDRTNPN